jgi:hypothetical protein
MILKSLKLSNRKKLRTRKVPKILSQIICQNWQWIPHLTSQDWWLLSWWIFTFCCFNTLVC